MNIYKYRYWIGGSLAVILIGVTILILRKKKMEVIPNVVKSNLEKGVIVTFPETRYDTYNLIIMWGGINWATPQWMYDQIPPEILFANNIFVIAPYTLNLPDVEFIYKPYLKTINHENIDSISIFGFSAGGNMVQKFYSPNYKMVGLIDPSTNANYVNLPFTSNTKIVYNDRNWTGYPAIAQVLPKLGNKIITMGGESERVALTHAQIPKYFLQKYLTA